MIKYLFFVFFLLISCNSKKKETHKDNSLAEVYLLIGTYTDAESEGIYTYSFNTETGVSKKIGVFKTKNPSYLVVDKNEKNVYSVEESDEKNSFIHAFSFNKKTGQLTLLNSEPTHGDSPCYLTIDPLGKNVFTANYGGGSISSFSINDNGSVSKANIVRKFNGENSLLQQKSKLHCVQFSLDSLFLFATDLGTDKVYRFKNTKTFDLLKNKFEVVDAPQLTGPRHFDFHPNGKYMYLLGELSGKVIVYDYNKGNLSQKQIIASDTLYAKGSADIHVSPNGKFLYASNRLKGDGIAIFSINQHNGKLKRIGYQKTGKHPRNFAITPNGKFLLLASRDDHKVQIFKINKKTGMLTNQLKDISLNKPVCIKFINKI